MFCIILCSHRVWNLRPSPNLDPSPAIEISPYSIPYRPVLLKLITTEYEHNFCCEVDDFRSLVLILTLILFILLRPLVGSPWAARLGRDAEGPIPRWNSVKFSGNG